MTDTKNALDAFNKLLQYNAAGGNYPMSTDNIGAIRTALLEVDGLREEIIKLNGRIKGEIWLKEDYKMCSEQWLATYKEENTRLKAELRKYIINDEYACSGGIPPMTTEPAPQNREADMPDAVKIGMLTQSAVGAYWQLLQAWHDVKEQAIAENISDGLTKIRATLKICGVEL